MADTPKMAIDTVRFVKKTEVEDGEVWETDGPLPDEVIAQRLAMIPIPTKHDEFYFQDECPNCAEMVEEDHKAARRNALLKEHGLELPVSLEG